MPRPYPDIIKKSDLKLKAYKDLMIYKNDTTECESNIYKLAVCIVAKYFSSIGETQCKLTHLCDVFLLDSVDWSENPGLPWCDSDFATKEDIRNDQDAIQSVRRFWHFVKLSYFKDNKQMKFPYCMVYSDPDKEQSLKWIYPATVNFGEALFTTNLVKLYSGLGEHGLIGYAFKNDPEGHKCLYYRLHQENRYYVKLEYNQNSVPSWLIEKAFSVFLLNIDPLHYERGGVPDVRFMYHMYKCIKDYFISTHIILVNGTCLVKQSGLPDGSLFTPLVGSIISAIIIMYLSFCIDGLRPEDYVVFGNESLARVRSYWDLNKCQEILKKDFGMCLNLSKSQVSKNLKHIRFLGFKKIYMR